MIQGPASQMLFGANHELNFYPGLYNFVISKASFWIISSFLLKASINQIIDKKNYGEFPLEAFTSEIRFHTNLGYLNPSFEKHKQGV